MVTNARTSAVAGARTPAGNGAGKRLRQGSPKKRAAIARAAFELFVAQGVAGTSVDAIAAEAGVSKRTVYDYYGSKERLFLSVIEDAEAAYAEQFTEILDRTLGEVDGTDGTDGIGGTDDLEAALVRFGRELGTTVARSVGRAAAIRLVITEAAHFPVLLDRWRGPGIEQRALAERLGALAERGVLAVPDPVEAAAHFGALVTSSVNHRSLFGVVPVGDAEIERIVVSGVRAFLLAYGPHRPAP
ncbi:TetR/AcrR family transcriptional regulator [Streptomyces sp. S465]|uniref:TetR/AcrR family transcriptional regulator n=1 Tax=Streptomyces sp. S465 TaxID=2979468 RepID=UPI0022A872A9|nr:TetR/AcrR family transcriptional regulator [Streptomyces sp. S465]WAP57585.1 TetR/AcrR family transcriptional regulator [Streptomyces sp. S465]